MLRVTVMTFSDIVESVILLKEDAYNEIVHEHVNTPSHGCLSAVNKQ